MIDNDFLQLWTSLCVMELAKLLYPRCTMSQTLHLLHTQSICKFAADKLQHLRESTSIL